MSSTIKYVIQELYPRVPTRLLIVYLVINRKNWLSFVVSGLT